MILIVILGVLIPIFFGYGISLFFFKDIDFYEKVIISVTMGFGILFYIIFVLNQVFKIKFDFVMSLVLLITLLILGVIFVMVNRKRIKKIKKEEKKKK
nr:hypothetical protein [Nanoarchaeota archaeon]